MSQFVEECRREWRRLGVPDPAAEEMACDLAADLAEAEAEGASAQHVLGTSAFDPRSFAAAWAAERGLVQAPPADDGGPERRSRVPAVLAGTAVIATLGLVLVLLANRISSTTQVESASPVPGPTFHPGGDFATRIHGDGYHHMIGFIVLVIAVVIVIAATIWWVTWASPGRSSPRRRSSIAGSH